MASKLLFAFPFSNPLNVFYGPGGPEASVNHHRGEGFVLMSSHLCSGPAHKRRLQPPDRRHAGPGGGLFQHQGALLWNSGHPEASQRPHRQRGRAVR